MNPPPSLQNLIEIVQEDSPSDDLLDLLITASLTVRQLEDVNDALLGHFVDRCRRAGRSWSQISAALGVSKQAVHKRFSVPIADRMIDGAGATLERFTPRARSVLVAADASARARNSDHVGGEHLLLGLYAEPEGLAARTLLAMEVPKASVEAALTGSAAGADDGPVKQTPASDAGTTGEAGGAGTTRAAGSTAGTSGSSGTAATAGESGRLPYAPDAATVLRDFVAEALELEHNYIGTEHILLGLLRDPDAPAARLLDQLGVSPAEVRVRIGEMLRALTPGA
jgi:ATP-dependent Clp protease ATP-binding subunit ClpA